MSISRGELKAKILRLLNRTSTNRGFYTDEKIEDAIEDGIDYITAEMHLAGEGWTNKIVNLATTQGQTMVPIPKDLSLINVVRYKSGNGYYPLVYSSGQMETTAAYDSGETTIPSTFRIIDNHLYFDSPLGETGTDLLQIEATTYPRLIKSDAQNIPAYFDKSMQHFLKFRSASYLTSVSGGKAVKEWAEMEAQWYTSMMSIVYRRTNTVKIIAEFDP